MDVWDCALGFMNSQMLLTAEELGVFDVLDPAPRTAADVATAVRLPLDSAERLLVGLCALGLVERLADGRLVNGSEAAEKLVRGKPGYIGSMFQHVREDLYPVWNHFKEALQEQKAQWERAFPAQTPPNEGIYDDPRSLRAFMEGMHAITFGAADELASYAPELGRVESIVDIGGASGAFVIALAQRFPKLRGTVVDLAPVQPIAEDFIRGAGLSDRVKFHSADFFHDPIPSGADAYSLGFVLHDWDTQAGSSLLEKIAKAARPGALLVVGEYLLNDDRTGPLWVARMDLNMLVAARGRERTAAEYIDWFDRFGFEYQQVYVTHGGKNFLVARRRESSILAA